MAEIFKDDYIIKKCKNKKVLHIGACDSPYHIKKAKNGELLHQKLNNSTKELVGIDFDKKSIKELKKFNINNIFFSDITKPLNLKDSNFDIIIFGDVLEHLSNPGLALKNLSSIMKKTTRLIITVPNCYCYFNIFNIFAQKENVHPDHVFWTSKQTMVNLLQRYCFDIQKIKYLNFGSKQDKITLKGRVFRSVILNHIPKIRNVLYFEVKIRK
ncbi:MAG: class I SAM-dependent methyltransferase [Candidatus Woesearchaeota archaeon]